MDATAELQDSPSMETQHKTPRRVHLHAQEPIYLPNSTLLQHRLRSRSNINHPNSNNNLPKNLPFHHPPNSPRHQPTSPNRLNSRRIPLWPNERHNAVHFLLHLPRNPPIPNNHPSQNSRPRNKTSSNLPRRYIPPNRSTNPGPKFPIPNPLGSPSNRDRYFSVRTTDRVDAYFELSC